MKRTSTLFSIMACLIAVTTLNFGTAQAVDSQQTKWRLTGTLENSGQVKATNSVSYIYEIQNTGTTNAYLNSPVLIYTPKEFSYLGYTAMEGFSCSYEAKIDAGQAQGATFMEGREKIYCSPSGSGQTPPILIEVAPGETFEFRINGKANSDFNSSTKSYGLYVYAMNSATYNAYTNNENIWESMPSDAVNSAPYSYSPTTTSTAQNNTVTTSVNNPSVLGNSAEAPNGIASNNGDPGYATIDDGSAAANYPKNANNPIAATRSAQLRDEVPKDDISWSQFLDQHRNEIALATLAFVIFLTGSIFAFRWLRRKNLSQREYRQALSLLKNQRSPHALENFDQYKPKQKYSTSVKRTQIRGQNVDVDMK